MWNPNRDTLQPSSMARHFFSSQSYGDHSFGVVVGFPHPAIFRRRQEFQNPQQLAAAEWYRVVVGMYVVERE